MRLSWVRGFASVVCVMTMAATAAAQGSPSAQAPASAGQASARSSAHESGTTGSAAGGAAIGASPQKAASVPELVTDRPDFTESADVVGRGFVQLEMGTTFELDRAAGASHRTVTLPLGLVRVGLGSWAEFRVSGDGFAMDSVRDAGSLVKQHGAADVELGVKFLLVNKPAVGFAIAALPMISLPAGSNGQSSGGYDTTVKFAWAKTLPAGFSVSGNFNVSRLTDEAGTFMQRATSVSFSHDLKGAWGAYWEVYGFTPPERGEKTAWTFDTGVSRGIGAGAQFDVEFGRGLTSSATDWFVGAGFAIRIAPFHRGR